MAEPSNLALTEIDLKVANSDNEPMTEFRSEAEAATADVTPKKGAQLAVMESSEQEGKSF